MTIWAKRICTREEWGQLQDHIADMQMGFGGPRDLVMLVKAQPGGHDDVFLGLPGSNQLSSFPGFDEMNREDIPTGVTILVCRADGFSDRFPDIAEKAQRV